MKLKVFGPAVLLATAAVAASAQQPPASTIPTGRPQAAAMVGMGEALYTQGCAVCHGSTGHGGMGGAPDLTQSAIAMANDGGAGLAAFLAVGRPDRGMPPHPVTEEQAAGLSAKLRSLGFASAGGAGGASAAAPTVLVGTASAGKAYFNGPVGQCSTCHAVAPGAPSSGPNLSHIGAKYPDPKTLQNAWILPERRFYWSPANSNDVSATVTYRDGRVLKGLLSSVSDFKVIIRDDAGKETVLERRDGEPKVVLSDRLQRHIDLLRLYHDTDIHDLTAYMATLK